MASYAVWQAAIRSWAEVSTGRPVLWENEKRPHSPKFTAFVILSGPHSVDQAGEDWVAYDTDGAPTVEARRELVYHLRVVSRSQAPDDKAGRYAELARKGLSLPAIRRALSAAGLAPAVAGSIRLMDAPFDDREESIASFEVRFNAVESDAPATAPDAEGVIEHVALTSDLDPAGTPPNVAGDVLPPL